MVIALHLIWSLVLGFGALDQSSVLIVSGQNNHDWERTVGHLEQALLDVGIFSVDVTLSPGKEADQEAWDGWQPTFGEYDVVVLAYNGELWPERVRNDFEEYVSGGGGVTRPACGK